MAQNRPSTSFFLSIFLFVVPFILPIHNSPIATFQTEISSLLGLLVLYYFYFKSNNANNTNSSSDNITNISYILKIPIINVIPIVLLAITIIQILSISNFSSTKLINNLVLGYIICLFLSFCIGYYLNSQNIDLPFNLSFGIIIVAIINCLIMIVQSFNQELNKINIFLYKYNIPLDYFISITQEKINIRPYGNLNQPNHITTLMAWSVIAWIYCQINSSSKLKYIHDKKIIFDILGFILIFGMVLPASRTIYLHAAVFCIINFLIYFYNKNLAIRIFIVWFCSLIISIFLIKYAKEAFSLNIMSVLDRDLNINSGQNLRYSLYQHGWLIFKQNPILGNSHGNFSWLQFINTSKLPMVEIANSSHNLIIDLLAKFGIIGTITVILFLGAFCLNLLKKIVWHKNLQPHYILALGLLGTFVAHAMMEYPQNYLFFIIPLALILGFCDTKTIKHGLSKKLVYLIISIVTVYTAILCVDFNNLQKPKKYKNVLILHPYVNFFHMYNINLTTLNKDTIDIYKHQLEDSLHLMINPIIMQKYIILCAYQGNIDLALKYTNNMLYFVNVKPDQYIKQLIKLTHYDNLKSNADIKQFQQKLKIKYPKYANE